MFVGSLVRHKGFIGITTAKRTLPSGLVRFQVEWCTTPGKVAKSLWWNSHELELLGTEEINILRGTC